MKSLLRSNDDSVRSSGGQKGWFPKIFVATSVIRNWNLTSCLTLLTKLMLIKFFKNAFQFFGIQNLQKKTISLLKKEYFMHVTEFPSLRCIRCRMGDGRIREQKTSGRLNSSFTPNQKTKTREFNHSSDIKREAIFNMSQRIANRFN